MYGVGNGRNQTHITVNMYNIGTDAVKEAIAQLGEGHGAAMLRGLPFGEPNAGQK